MTDTTAPIEKRAERAAGSKMSAGIMKEVPYWLRVQRVGGSLTPEVVSMILREADIGMMGRLCDLGDDARQKDCTLQSTLETRENAVASLPWSLVLPENPKLKEKKAAQLIEQVLKPILPILVPHLNGSVFPGYAVAEIGWSKVGGFLIPTSITPRRARRFRYAFEDETLLWWDTTMSTGVDVYKEHPGRFVISQPRVNGSARCREGLIRPLMWAAMFRSWAIGDWMKLAELAWKPWRIGEYDKDASEEDIAALNQVLDQMTSTGVAALPSTVKLTVASPGGNNGTQAGGAHAALVAMLAAEMAKCVLGQTLTTEQGSVGTQALGTVHDDVRKDKRDADARFIERDIGRDLIDFVVYLNFGEGTRSPALRFHTEDKTDLVQFATGIQTLGKAGVRIPTSFIYSEAGIPEPKGDEETIGGAQEADEQAPNTAPQEKPDGSEEEDPKGADAKPEK